MLCPSTNDPNLVADGAARAYANNRHKLSLVCSEEFFVEHHLRPSSVVQYDKRAPVAAPLLNRASIVDLGFSFQASMVESGRGRDPEKKRGLGDRPVPAYFSLQASGDSSASALASASSKPVTCCT